MKPNRSLPVKRSFLRAAAAFLPVFFLVSQSWSQVFTIGTNNGTNSSTTYPTPFGDYFEGSRQQYLFLASELTAAGMTAGSITAISWNVTALNGAGVHEQYTISIGTTASTVLSATAWETTSSTVYGPVNYQPVTGVNTFTFGTPFVWNGTSNIVVNVCHGAANTTSGNLYSSNASVQYYQAPAGVFVTRGNRADNTNNFCGYTGTANNDFSTNAQRRLRPVTQFTMSTAACTGTPAPGNTLTSSSAVCSGANFTLSLQNSTVGTGVTYQWQSGPGVSGPWTNFGSGSSTQITSQSAATWYRCQVTCSGNTGNSTPVQVTMNGPCACLGYCAASQTTGSCANADEYISNVTFNTINNTSNCAASLPGGYTNYTNIGTTVTQGTGYTLSVSNGNGYTGDQCHAYFDWNGDGAFTGTGEDITLTGGPLLFTATITPPPSSIIGGTRMRVRVFYTGATASCGALGYGEAEDYCLTIQAAANCTGTPTAGTAAISSTGNCLTNNVTLTASGYSTGAGGLLYQWQSSPDGSTGWTDIATATNPATFTTTATTATWYRLRVRCNPTSTDVYTNVVAFSMPFTVNAGPDIPAGCVPTQLSGSITGSVPRTIYSENFEGVGANGVINPTYGGWTEAYIGGGSNTYWGIANTCPISGSYSMTAMNGNNGNYCVYIAGNDIDIVSASPLINATGYTNLRLSFNYRCQGEPDDGFNSGLPYDFGQVAYSTDGTNWYLLPQLYYNQPSVQSATNLDLSAMDGQQFYLGFRWANDLSTGGNPPFTVDDIVITGNATTSVPYTWSGGTFSPNANVQNPTVSASGTYTLTVTSGGCTSTDNVSVTVSAPNAASYATGDYLWTGATSTDWLTLSNWLTDNGSAMVVPGSLPTGTNDVFIDPAGACVPNQPVTNTSGSTVAARDLTIRTGATLGMTGGDLNIFRNFTNNGTFNYGTGTVSFEGTANSLITGVSNFYGMRVNKTSATSQVQLTSNIRVQNSLLLPGMGDILAGSYTLELGVNAGSPGALTWTGTSTILGNIKRWISTSTGIAYTFPVGNDVSGTVYNRYARLTYTSPPNGGSLTVHFVPGPASYTTGLPLDDSGQPVTNFANEGYWEIAPGDGLSSGTYDLTLRGNNFTTVTNLQALRLIKSPMPHNTWTLQGTHAGPNTGTLTDPIVSRSGMSGYSFFTIGGDDANPLPVELVSFEASCSEGKVKLDWATASEENNQYFSVERSTDGSVWEEVARVNGAGNSNTLQSYSWADAEKSNGTFYYRLTQVDYNGDRETFTPDVINCSVENGNSILLYPNPATDQVTILLTLDKDYGDAVIRFADMTGRITNEKNVVLKQGENKFVLNDISALQSGAYSVSVMKEGLVLPVKKLVIK